MSAPQSSGTLANVAFAAVVVTVCGTEAVSHTNAQPHSLVTKPYCVCTPDPFLPTSTLEGSGNETSNHTDYCKHICTYMIGRL